MQKLSVPYSPDTVLYIDQIMHETGLIWFHNGADSAESEWFSAWPSKTYQYNGQNAVTITDIEGNSRIVQSDFLSLLKKEQNNFASNEAKSNIFTGGFAGHLTYDFGLEIHNIISKHPKLDYPLAVVSKYDWSCVINHNNFTASIYIQPLCPDFIVKKIKLFVKKIDSINKSKQKEQHEYISDVPTESNWSNNTDRNKYSESFSKIKDYISEGDIYQANLTRQWLLDNTTESDWQLYKKLIKKMPAPFSVFHRHTSHSLLSVSPERFIKIEQNKLITQPIKGTRPRGVDEKNDKQLKEELFRSEKDRAENLMIVDLLRNDLSKNAVPGSINVESLFDVVTYKNVHHLVSTITATRKNSSHPLDVLYDALPGGSITGAPKKRAIQIIDELETKKRGNYCGCAFFINHDGYMDSNILIRTMTKVGSSLICGGGGGIVSDSDCTSEFEESAVKVNRLLAAIKPLGINI